MLDKNTFDKGLDFHGVKGLIFLEDKIIVFRRDNKTKDRPLQIDLIGGGRGQDETPFENFKREAKEEVGLDLQKDDIVFCKRYEGKKYEGTLYKSKFSYFFATRPLKFKESDIIFGNEGLEYMLMTPQEFIALPDAVKEHQDKALDYLKYPLVTNNH